jgi:hypothetical protein
MWMSGDSWVLASKYSKDLLVGSGQRSWNAGIWTIQNELARLKRDTRAQPQRCLRLNQIWMCCWSYGGKQKTRLRRTRAWDLWSEQIVAEWQFPLNCRVGVEGSSPTEQVSQEIKTRQLGNCQIRSRYNCVSNWKWSSPEIYQVCCEESSSMPTGLQSPVFALWQ